MIAGFCGETEEDHQLTLDLMRQVEIRLRLYVCVF